MSTTVAAPALDLELIRTPPARLRGTPFWSWNHDVTDHAALRAQIDALAEMGMGGVHIHSRIGLRTPYLSPEWFAAVHAARDHAHGKGMLTWLYDEDTWPSGFAGGAVGRDLRWRQRWLTVAPQPPQDQENSHTSILACWRVQLDDNGFLVAAERVDPGAARAGDWWAWTTIAPDSSRYNGGGYLDVLNPAAVDAFIASTHERYREAFGGSFPADVPAMFTDEPQFARFNGLSLPQSGEARFPWTDDLPQTFAEATGHDLIAAIPDLVWTRRSGPSDLRWHFFDHVSERFAAAFADRIGAWCQRSGIAMTGHLMNEPALHSQLASVGEAMRHYRSFHIPGIDILCDRDELTTAKQAASVARQDGRSGVLSELYGVTDWDFSFAGHKRQGDWQAALGITIRVHHLTWLSMAGDAKRDYPASIGPQAPWYREYRVIEDHFARVGAALTQGRARVRIAVIHPIESAWLHSGPTQTDGAAFSDLDSRFQTITAWLLEAQLDFDFISESLLPRQLNGVDAGRLHVGAMAYDVVIVPGVETLRRSTAQALRALLDGGGTVIICGQEPTRLDGRAAATEVASACAGAMRLAWSQVALLAALEPWRDMIVQHQGRPHGAALYQMRELEDGSRICFICDRRRSVAVSPWQRQDPPVAIRLRGAWDVQEIDTATGALTSVPAELRGGWTEVAWQAQPADHRLLHLVPGAPATKPLSPARVTELGDLPAAKRLIRDEANVLVLDRAAWCIDDEAWQDEQDVMVTHRHCVDRFAWPGWCQPWCVGTLAAPNRLRLRFAIRSETTLRAPRLALERAEETQVSLDGEAVAVRKVGHWVDPCFSMIALPDLGPGEHVLILDQPIDALRRPEYAWLLHDGGVRVSGERATLVAADRAAPSWGDLVHQGLPFYAGNMTYLVDVPVSTPGGYRLYLPRIGGPLARVTVDGRDAGVVTRAPWRADLGQLAAGVHEIGITVFGHRRNAFGATHCDAPGWSWWGPGSWFQSGANTNPAWILRPIGVLRAPMLERYE